MNSCKSQVYLNGIKMKFMLLNNLKFDDRLDFFVEKQLAKSLFELRDN